MIENYSHKNLILNIFPLIFFIFFLNGISGAQLGNHREMIPNIVIIKFKTDPQIENYQLQKGSTYLNKLLYKHSINSMQQVVKTNGFKNKTTNYRDIHNLYYAFFTGNNSPDDVAASLKLDPLIEYAEPKYVYEITAIPNDSLYHRQEWYLNIIKAPQAWDIVKGENGDVVIAIVDGGTHIHHPDLIENIWSNEREVNGTEGSDDDGNGYTDDYYGWNFANESGDPTGDNPDTWNNANHGTLTAGIVSAISDNFTDISGVSWNAVIMGVNASSADTDWKISYGPEGILYAAENGADIINCSWGSYDVYSESVKEIIQYAGDLGSVVVAAAGNDNSDLLFFPASYENTLSIGGASMSDEKWADSNHGRTVDLSAPADSIFGILADGGYVYASGTSLAAPIVAGVVGLVKTNNPDWTGIQAGEQVRVTADSIFSEGKEFGTGRVNAFRALTENPVSISFVGYDYFDENNNQIVEIDEQIFLYITVLNYLAPANNVSLKISTFDDGIILENEEITLPLINTFEPIRLSDPIIFEISKELADNSAITFNLQITADGYHAIDQFKFKPTIFSNSWIKYNDPKTTTTPFHESDPVLVPGPVGDWDDTFVSVQTVSYDKKANMFKMWYQGGTGPYTGSIGYAISFDGINWTKYNDPSTIDPPFSASDPVIKPGSSGEWDSMVTGMSSVLFQDTTYHMWYTGYSDLSAFHIGYAYSSDGIKWVKHDKNPVITTGPEGSWDEAWVSIPSVIFENSVYKMWYTGHQGNPETFENWQSGIGYATSPNGINWTKHDKPVIEPRRSQYEKFDYWQVFSPYVFLDGNIYKMWYAGYDRSNHNIGFAKSINGTTWYRSDNPVLNVGSIGEWDLPSVQNPSILKIDSTYHMWYSAGDYFAWNVGYARSDWEDFPNTLENLVADNIPRQYSLSNNYPNPFNPRTTIKYSVKAYDHTTQHVNLSIYNLIGQKVATLVNERKQAGNHQVEWNASDIASGIYYYLIKAGEFQQVKKMILLK